MKLKFTFIIPITFLSLFWAGTDPWAESPKPPFKDLTFTKKTPWTPAQVRKFVVDTYTIINLLNREAYKNLNEKDIIGKCAGEPAARVIRYEEVRYVLSQRIEGDALRYFIETHVGCRIGEWLTFAGVSRSGGPSLVPFHQSPVTILAQSADRVVANFGELELVDVSINGDFDPEYPQALPEFTMHSNFTLHRDSKGVWRIAKRECDWDKRCGER